ncbi:FAD-dependent oxidoreductase [Nocardia sp. CDC153]|uniref:flavin monoamine oxidase family protein n=1 Tax=Nocardia sp. CDC153 TaxID=3112167 RepID=UPI002DB79B58|nr:FAD-dependent oxidoreductase [Nocardia sp. CDC153]MEC3953233.1 FAD-dependent oxidoreductase [Nocardia sp. CDC153]
MLRAGIIDVRFVTVAHISTTPKIWRGMTLIGSLNSSATGSTGGFPELPNRPQPSTTPPVSEDLLTIARKGFEHNDHGRKRVIVLGGGVAGLVAAFELERQGHEPIVLEAQHRIGGRIYTMRQFAPGLFAEAGAMRIPRVHTLTLAYCALFGLNLRPFVMDNPRAMVNICGNSMTFEEAESHVDQLFKLADHERGKTWTQLWNEATSEIKSIYDQEGPAGWDRIMSQYDDYSLRQFLKSKGWSDGAIEMYAIMSFREQNMNTAVVEQFFEIVGRCFEDMQYIEGGTDRLTEGFYRHISHRVRFGADVQAIKQDESSVTVEYKNRGGRYSVTGDYAICTLPFPVLSNIEIEPALSKPKRQAIRELRYNASTKILFQVRRRFWEEPPYNILGGTTTTDLPIRRIVYPSPGSYAPDEERGVLLASYTWGQDALRWGSLSEDECVYQALEDVAKIHPEIMDAFEFGTRHAWFNDPYAGGAFAQFEPGQASRIQKHILEPEGRLLFAGEHCSLYHAWIQGALESGLRAAKTIHEAPLSTSSGVRESAVLAGSAVGAM